MQWASSQAQTSLMGGVEKGVVGSKSISLAPLGVAQCLPWFCLYIIRIGFKVALNFRVKNSEMRNH